MVVQSFLRYVQFGYYAVIAALRMAFPKASQLFRKMSCRNIWHGSLNSRHLCSSTFCNRTCVSHGFWPVAKFYSFYSLTSEVDLLF